MWSGGGELIVWLLVYVVVVGVGLMGVSYVLVWGVLEVSLVLSLTYFVWGNSRVGGVFYYYVVQALSSLMMIVGALVGEGLMVMVSFLVKMGLFPVFVWMVGVVWSLEMGGSVMLVLWAQKLVPLLLLFEWGWVIDWGSSLFVGTLCLGIVVGSLFMATGATPKWLLTMSSLVHTSWLVIIMMGSCGALMFYFMTYGGLLAVVLGGFEKNWMVVGGLMTLSSVPPLLGFMLKFYSLSLVIRGAELLVAVGVVVVIGTVVGYFVNMNKMALLMSAGNGGGTEVVSGAGLVLLLMMMGSVF
uniref:NADH dehydrogenase subunit 2 n=1 Tax=Centrorhynchus aluconis TaxID=1795424 RepID=A0A140DJ71_9BILA|nr:NADH dehydrogenase subunit 2 [Centrorhynchus aluconis]